MATGHKDGIVKFWDVRSQQVIEQHQYLTGRVNSLSFSNKGVFIGVAGDGDAAAAVVDLRKMANPPALISHPDTKSAPCISFDSTGTLLATAADNVVSVYQQKQWKEPLVQFDTFKGLVHAVKFAPSGSFIVGGGKDRNIRFFGQKRQ